MLMTVYKDQKKENLTDRIQTGAKHTKPAGATEHFHSDVLNISMDPCHKHG